MEGMSRRREREREREREAINNELDRIILGLDADPRATERRCARMSEGNREEVRALRLTFDGLSRACGVPPGRLGRRITFRVEGGKVVREAEEVIPADGAVGDSSPSAATASGSEDDLCSAFGSARF